MVNAYSPGNKKLNSNRGYFSFIGSITRYFRLASAFFARKLEQNNSTCFLSHFEKSFSMSSRDIQLHLFAVVAVMNVYFTSVNYTGASDPINGIRDCNHFSRCLGRITERCVRLSNLWPNISAVQVFIHSLFSWPCHTTVSWNPIQINNENLYRM